MAISSVLLTGIYSFFISQQEIQNVRGQVAEMQQNVRIAMAIMTREMRMTGYGAPQTNLPSWIPWVAGLTTNPKITQGPGTTPDTITIVGFFDAPIASLTAAAAVGATSLSIQYTDPDKTFNTSSKKVFRISDNENGMIIGTAGNILTIDMDPTIAGNQGLTRGYPIGTSLTLLKVITYNIVDTTLKRDENTGAGGQPLAEGIEDMRITQNGTALTLTLTGRTAQPQPHYTHPTKGDHYRRVKASSRLRPRNL